MPRENEKFGKMLRLLPAFFIMTFSAHVRGHNLSGRPVTTKYCRRSLPLPIYRICDILFQYEGWKGDSSMSRLLQVGVFLMFVLSCSSVATAGVREKEESALSTANKWLTMLDEGKYSESWQEASSYFQNAVKEDEWKEKLKAYRMPLGKLLHRKVKTETYTTSLPGAPDGEYVVIRFQTSFGNKKDAVETVTPMIDRDGKWHVSGYYIK
jgi:hypothetical protein